jgi:HEAT repeat protein
MPLVRGAMVDKDWGVRGEAVTAFGRINRDARLTAALLARMLADSNESVRESAATILENIGPESVGPVVEVLHGDLPVERHRTLRVLLRVLQSNTWSRGLDVARSLLSDRDQDVRLAALTVVVAWGAGSNEQIRELLKTDEGVETALDAIARRGLDAAELVPDVVAVLDQQEQLETLSGRGNPPGAMQLHPRFRAILAALSSLKTAARPAASILVRRLGKLHSGSRVLAMATLVDIGAPAGDLIPFLTPLLTSGPIDQPILSSNRRWDEREVIHRAGIVLRRASPEEGRRQAALLIPRLKTADGKVDKSVLYALWGLGPAAADALPVLMSLVPNSDGEVFWHAVVTMGEIGPQAAPAVPAFVAALEAGSHDTDSEICQRIIEALGRIGPAAKSAVPMLLRIIDEPERFVLPDARSNVPWAPMFRAMAILSVGQLDDGSPEVLASLRSLVASAPHDVRMAAIGALAHIAERTPQVLGDLVALLRHDNAAIRGQAALAIGRLSLDRAAAIEPLIENLAVEDPYLCAASVLALGQIGPDARAALSVLRRIESNPDSSLALWKGGMPSYARIPELQNLTLEQAAREAVSRIDRDSE